MIELALNVMVVSFTAVLAYKVGHEDGRDAEFTAWWDTLPNRDTTE